jgi:hypothetical protein
MPPSQTGDAIGDVMSEKTSIKWTKVIGALLATITVAIPTLEKIAPLRITLSVSLVC